MKQFSIGERVELIDNSDSVTTGTVIGTAVIGQIPQMLYVVKLDPDCAGYIHFYSNGNRGGYVSAVVVHPDNILHISC